MYTARLQSAPPRPPMNENRDRGHRPDPSAAVALSSQNVSTDASDRVASRATPSGASTTRDAPSPPPCKRQKMVSVPPGTRASAPGRRIQSIFRRSVAILRRIFQGDGFGRRRSRRGPRRIRPRPIPRRRPRDRTPRGRAYCFSSRPRGRSLGPRFLPPGSRFRLRLRRLRRTSHLASTNERPPCWRNFGTRPRRSSNTRSPGGTARRGAAFRGATPP